MNPVKQNVYRCVQCLPQTYINIIIYIDIYPNILKQHYKFFYINNLIKNLIGFHNLTETQQICKVLTNKDKHATAQKENLASTSPHLSPMKLPSGCCKFCTYCTIRSIGSSFTQSNKQAIQNIVISFLEHKIFLLIILFDCHTSKKGIAKETAANLPIFQDYSKVTLM